ncbi:hypothetical protein O3P69_010070 [Scylla paramamosain]|uniref:Uncharacterized protein n=1 Tax=Scylla paramamosain TaxID=85552 RepID=A0AAW0SQ34_SCYPA
MDEGGERAREAETEKEGGREGGRVEEAREAEGEKGKEGRIRNSLSAPWSAAGICVVDNKKGWFVSCGVRDSYLFRLKDYGGINANFDFSKCAVVHRKVPSPTPASKVIGIEKTGLSHPPLAALPPSLPPFLPYFVLYA